MGEIRVMLVEDHLLLRQGTKELLDREEDLTVISEAGDGEEAIRLASANPPDVVVMDISMPRLDGIGATAKIRDAERSTGAHMPIIALTAHAMAEDRERFLQAGMDGYATKPLKSDRLLAVLDEVLGSDTDVHDPGPVA